MWPKLDETLKKFHEVEQQLADPEITVDHVKYNRLAKEHGNLAKMAKPYLEYKKVDSDIRHLETGIEAEADAEMQQMMQEELRTLREKRDGLHSKLEDMLLVDPSEDFDSIIVEVRAGVGGDEAALFAGDLYRMYVRYAESQGWKVETLDFNGTELGGFKEVSFNVAGEGCYRQLRFESGGHRVQRVPDTETQGRIHTSAATVAVMPEPTEIHRGPRRAAPEQDAIRRPPHAHPHRHRGREPHGKEPTQEQGHLLARPPYPHLRAPGREGTRCPRRPAQEPGRLRRPLRAHPHL
jgi:peptide chain release factor 1